MFFSSRKSGTLEDLSFVFLNPGTELVQERFFADEHISYATWNCVIIWSSAALSVGSVGDHFIVEALNLVVGVHDVVSSAAGWLHTCSGRVSFFREELSGGFRVDISLWVRCGAKLACWPSGEGGPISRQNLWRAELRSFENLWQTVGKFWVGLLCEVNTIICQRTGQIIPQHLSVCNEWRWRHPSSAQGVWPGSYSACYSRIKD